MYIRLFQAPTLYSHQIVHDIYFLIKHISTLLLMHKSIAIIEVRHSV